MAVGSVDTWEGLVVTQADLEGAVLRVVRGIVRTANTVVDVLTVIGRVRASRVAHFEAELVTTHKAKKMQRISIKTF